MNNNSGKWYNWLNKREALLQKYRSWNVSLLWECLYYDSGMKT